MRKPRDIDAELRALETRTTALKARKVAQLGELVIATGADALEAEVLAGALLAAVEAAADSQTAWRRRGAAFFRGGARAGQSGGNAGDRPQAGQASGSETSR